MSPVPPRSPSVSAQEAASGLIRAAWEEARQAYGDLGLSADDFAQAVRRVATRHLGWAGLDATPQRLEAFARSAALADLYLALACEAGTEEAWRCLHAAYFPRLAGAAVRRGLRGEAAETAARQLLGDLALPAPNDRARTLLGTYDGSGSLWGWLRIILARRLSKPPPQVPTAPGRRNRRGRDARRCARVRRARPARVRRWP